ncbi:integrase catalytic domain-containing protein [Caerostris darwini]|uniref:Integrase catalytic domain-containing protein n=1 Tax=Caerostris darwini TaxID=1538125 RepID=A0AAV4U862_9ARAC|nr:integrase catalytic domain-containing protein [Caerostris darwini]
MDFDSIHLWSNSTIVISWIHCVPKELKTFICNQVSKIQELSSCDQWHHVASDENLESILYRGQFPEEQCKNHLWWYGPEFFQGSRYMEGISE